MSKYIIFLLSFLMINNLDAYDNIIKKVGNNDAYIYKIPANGDYKLVVSVSSSGDTLEDLVKKEGGEAGINRAYFCPADYPECAGKNFSDGNRISNGKIFSRWYNTGDNFFFALDANNKPFIYNTPHENPDTFEGIYNGVSNFPLILKGGQSYLDYYEQKGLLNAKMRAKRYKNFICYTQENDIYMGYIKNASIYEMVDLLKSLSCFNAINLDSGGSLSSYNNGAYVFKHSRKIMDAFVIVKNPIKKEELKKENIQIPEEIKEEKVDVFGKHISKKLISTYKYKLYKKYSKKLSSFSSDKKSKIKNKIEIAISKMKNESKIALFYSLYELL